MSNHTQKLDQLIQMTEVDYLLNRKELAKELGLGVNSLDKVWKSLQKDKQQNTTIQRKEIEPWKDTVSIDSVINEFSAILDEVMVIEPNMRDAVAWWSLATWFVDYTDIAPYLMITAPEKRCGKSQLMSLLSKLTFNASASANMSAAALYYVLDQKPKATILLDEVDQYLHDVPNFIGILNAGHGRELGFVDRIEGEKKRVAKKYDCFGFKAISGISSKNISETLADRSIIIELKRKNARVQKKKLRDISESIFYELQRKCTRLVQDFGEKIRSHHAERPSGLNDRQFDNWSLMLALAELSGNSYWLGRAKEIAVAISRQSESFQKSYEHERLVLIAAALLTLKGSEPTAEEISSRIPISYRITARSVADVLKVYGLRSKQKMRNGHNLRCYQRCEIEEVTSAYVTRSEIDEITLI